MNKKECLQNVFSDIRTWIFIFFVIRLIGITNPPLEISHNWRQSLCNMIARNFLELDANIFYPRIDMAGNLSGIIGSEFPGFNYLIYILSAIFGYEHWYGRLLNLFVSSMGVYAFYNVLKNVCDRKIAFNASIILLSSIWFAFSRKIMPDTFSVALVIIGLNFIYQYIAKEGFWNLLLFFCCSTIGMLCKIPALSLFVAIGIIFFIRQIPVRKKLIVGVAALVSLSIVCLWYFYWVPYLVRTYHFELFFPKGLIEGLEEIIPHMPQFFEKFYFDALSSFIVLPFFIYGGFVAIKMANRYLKLGLAIIIGTFFIFILKTGSVFPLHNYYIIPFVPIMALISAFGLSKLPSKFSILALIFISIEAISNQHHDFFIKSSEKYKLTLEAILDLHTAPNDLIVINGTQSPQHIYFAHRKGWSIEHNMVNQGQIDFLRSQGAKYWVVDRHFMTPNFDQYLIIYEDKNYTIHSLRK